MEFVFVDFIAQQEGIQLCINHNSKGGGQIFSTFSALLHLRLLFCYPCSSARLMVSFAISYVSIIALGCISTDCEGHVANAIG